METFVGRILERKLGIQGWGLEKQIGHKLLKENQTSAWLRLDWNVSLQKSKRNTQPCGVCEDIWRLSCEAASQFQGIFDSLKAEVKTLKSWVVRKDSLTKNKEGNPFIHTINIRGLVYQTKSSKEYNNDQDAHTEPDLISLRSSNPGKRPVLSESTRHPHQPHTEPNVRGNQGRSLTIDITPQRYRDGCIRCLLAPPLLPRETMVTLKPTS